MVLPIERAAMQVHHGFDIKRVGAHAVNDGIGKAMEVELAILAPDFAPAFRLSQECGPPWFGMPQENRCPSPLAAPRTTAPPTPLLRRPQDG